MITFAYSDNSEEITKSLAGLQAALSDQRSALGEVADDFREMVAAQFASEGRAGGTPWAGRKSVGATRRVARRGRGTASPLLVQTGALRDSLTRKGAPGSIEDQNDHSLTLGSRLPHAIFHQLGTRLMPARPLIVLNDARTARWTEFVRRAFERSAPQLGKKELGGRQL